MNNITTFETAAELKAAGFPQPVPEIGQVWYNRNEHLCICIKNFTHDSLPGVMFFNTATEATFSVPESDFADIQKRDTFAPTATDILRELPNVVYRRYSETHWQLGELTLPEKGPHIVDFQRSHHENDAEMLARKWLSLNEKTEQK